MAIALGACGCGLHLGRSPSNLSSISLGGVEVAAPEPRLQEDLSRALAREASTRVPIGLGPSLWAQVLEARVAPVSPGGTLWEATLSVRFHLDTDPPRSQVATARRLIEGHPGSWEHSSTGRAEAFGLLADQLAAEAIPVLLVGDGSAPR